MKKIIKLCLLLMFLNSLQNLFSETKSSISFTTGSGEDSSFVENNSLYLEWIYKGSSSLLNYTGGLRFTSSSVDFSFRGYVYKYVLKDSVKFSGGAVLHSSFLSNKAFLQDSFVVAALDIHLTPIHTKYGIMGGIGFNNTYVWQNEGIWINEFYPIICVYLEVNVLDRVTLEASLCNSTFFTYDFWSPKSEFSVMVKLSDKFSALGNLILHYTPNAANDNIQMEGMEFGVGLKYEL